MAFFSLLPPEQLEAGYWRAYKDFYRWSNIVRGAWSKPELMPHLRHLAYSTGWKKFEFLWNLIIRAKQVTRMLPMLEAILDEFGSSSGKEANRRGREGAREELLPIAVPDVVQQR